MPLVAAPLPRVLIPLVFTSLVIYSDMFTLLGRNLYCLSLIFEFFFPITYPYDVSTVTVPTKPVLTIGPFSVAGCK